MAGFGANDEVLPTGSGFGGSNDRPLGTTPVTGRRAQDLGDAIISGLQNSATGLALRGKLPSVNMDAEAPWYQRLAAGAAGVVADLPLSVVGAVPGGMAGAAAAGPAAPIGAVVGGGAGAFAAPMALREALIEAYNNDHALSWSGVWEIAKSAMKGGAKGAAIGAVTGGAGAFVGRAVGTAIAPAVGSTIGARTAIGAIETASLGAELTALTGTAAALEGHMPTWQDFMDNAILLGGMKAATATAKSLRNIYVETGRAPERVLADAQANPALKAELTGQAHKVKVVEENTGGNKYLSVTSPSEKGYVTTIVENGVAKITHASLPDAERNQGIGTAMYERLVTAANERGLRVVSDDVVSPEAQRVYASLARRGFAVEQNPAATLDAKGDLRLPRGEPVFTISAPVNNGVPAAYRGLALEQRIQAAIDADPRPEMIRQNLAPNKVPFKIGESAISDPVKYEYITDSATAKGVLREVTTLYEKEMLTQTRGVVPNRETAVAGLKMATDGVLSERAVGQAANAAEIYARAHLLKGATNHAVQELGKIANLADADLTPSAKLQALASLERVAMLKGELEGVAAEAGRSLQIFRAMKRDPSFLGEAETLLKLAERKGKLQDIAALAMSLKDPAQLAEFARQYTKATTMEKVIEGWKAAILSGPQTHLANIMGNSVKWALDIPETAIAATFTAAQRAAAGDPLTMAQYKARALAPLYGLQFGAKDALTVAAEVARGRGETLEKADVYRTAIEGTKGEIIRLPFKALQVQDALFRTVAERAEAHIMAVDRAAKEGFHPESREFREAVVKYTARPETGLSEKAGLEAIARVEQAGLEAVFSQRLGPRLETLQRAMAGHWSQFIIPFVRTPANLVSWAVQHVPGLNLMSGRWREDFAAGGERQSKAVARVVIGAGLTTMAYSLAQDGLITGGGSFDPEQRRTKTAAGWQPYSVKVGDSYYSFQRMEPAAKVLGIAADLIELQQAATDEQDKAKIASMLVLMFGNATVSTTYLSGLSNAIGAVTDPARKGENFLEQYASSVVPKIVGQSVAMADPYKREVDGVIDAIQSQIPILREKLVLKRDAWGEPQKNDRWFEVMPVAKSEISEDKVKTEAVRLQIAIADAPRFVTERGPFNPKDKRVEMQAEQRDIFREVSGKNAMTILGPIVNAPDWKNIPDYAKAEIYKRVIEGTRKQAQYAALPPDDAARAKIRQDIVDRIVRESQAAQGSR